MNALTKDRLKLMLDEWETCSEAMRVSYYRTLNRIAILDYATNSTGYIVYSRFIFLRIKRVEYLKLIRQDL